MADRVKESCVLCNYYISESSGRGTCHRYPPTGKDEYGLTWPDAYDDGWCGEFRRRGSKSPHRGGYD